MLFKDEQFRSVTGRRPFYECMYAHPHELSFNLYQRDDEYKEPHDDAAGTLQSLNENSRCYNTYAASTPNVCSAPCLVAHGTWKYATLNPPSVRARLMSAEISPCIF